MNKSQNKTTGNIGEDIVAEYLKKRRYEILERNLELSLGEIDILARDGKTIVIVEVKTVRGGGFGLAQELVRYKKQEKLRLLGRLIEQQYPNRAVRIDVAGVDLSEEKPRIEYIENAIY